MAAKLLNIECGKRICKVAVSEKRGKAYSISDCFTFATPEGAVVDGQIVNPVELGEKLKQEMAMHAVSATDVIFSVTSTKIATREVTLPIVKEDQIRNVIRTNISDYFPIDTSKYLVDTMLLNKTKKESRVLVVAMPIAMSDSYTTLADAAGLTVEALDFSGNSQYQVLKGFRSEGVNMYISIDPDSASVAFMEEGNMLMQRALSVGGDEMICRYMATQEMMDEDYLKALQELSVSKENPTAIADTEEFSDCLSRLVTGLSRSVDYFRSGSEENAEKPIERIVLMGSCCHLAGLKELVADVIASSTYWLEEVPEMQGLANSIESISVYINSLGARVAPMNFLTDEYLKRTGRAGGKKKSAAGSRYGLLVFGAGLLIGAVLCGIVFMQNRSLNGELNNIEKEIDQKMYAEETYNSYLRYQAGDKQLQTFVDGSLNNNEKLLDFFTELERKMPSAIAMLSADCTSTGVTMSVEVPGFDEAAAVIRQFRTFESIDIVQVSSMTKTTSEDNSPETVSFTITCLYKVPETTTVAVVTEAATEEE